MLTACYPGCQPCWSISSGRAGDCIALFTVILTMGQACWVLTHSTYWWREKGKAWINHVFSDQGNIHPLASPCIDRNTPPPPQIQDGLHNALPPTIGKRARGSPLWTEGALTVLCPWRSHRNSRSSWSFVSKPHKLQRQQRPFLLSLTQQILLFPGSVVGV